MPHPSSDGSPVGKLPGEALSASGSREPRERVAPLPKDGSVPKPGTDAHDRLRAMIQKRLDLSYSHLTSRHEVWRRQERAYRLFVAPEETIGPQVDAVTDYQESLFIYPTSIVVPMSYAITQTIIAFWVTLFTSALPYFRVGNRTPESAGAAKAQELILGYQLDTHGYIPLLYQWFLDAMRYGHGIVKNFWEIKEKEQTFKEHLTIPLPTGPVQLTVKGKRPVVEYEGNHPKVLDPWSWRPDPRHPIACFQEGSFCGESTHRSYFDLLRDEDSGLYENVRAIPQVMRQEFSKMGRSDRERIMQVNRNFGSRPDNYDTSIVLVEECPLDLIPRETGIGESEKVERYLCVLANRAVVIRAEPYPYDHQEFAYSLIESAPDLHSLLNPGLMELMEPACQHISWFYNATLENQRKALNDRFLIDPSKLEMDDVLNPSAGQYVRLDPKYYGTTDLESVIKQIPVQDVTSGGLQTASLLSDLLQRMSAASDAIQGQPRSKRSTATEISAAAQQSSLRLRMMAKLMSAHGMIPLVRQMVQNNQSFMSQELYLRLVGSLEDEYRGIGRSVGQNGITVSPEDIQGQFDFPIFDGSMPLDPVRYSEVWMNLAKMTIEHPLLAQAVDHVAMFRQIAHSLGVTDISRFLLPQVRVMADQQVAQQEQAGNLVGMGQKNGKLGQPNGQMFSPPFRDSQANPLLGP